MPIHLTEINVYPLKSTRRVALDACAVERRGLRGDRRWMLVNEDGVFLTQRDFPRLALVETSWSTVGLRIQAPNRKPIHVPRPTGTSNRVQVWRDTVAAADAGDEPADWFEDFLATPVRLVYMTEESIRHVDREYAVDKNDRVSFADGYPLLLASEKSLAALNHRLETPVPMTRFRPNLVVSGADPFEEDAWRVIRIGDVRFHVVKGCARCVVTTIDQETAEQGKEPLRTLNRFRKRDGGVYFGQNLIPENEGVVRLNDAVHIEAVTSENLPRA